MLTDPQLTICTARPAFWHGTSDLLTYNLRIVLKWARAAADNPAWDPTTHGAVMMVPFFFVMWVMFVALGTCLGAHPALRPPMPFPAGLTGR